MTVNALNLGSPTRLHQPLSDVPSEIARQILSHLSPLNLVKISTLSSAMQKQTAPILWRQLWLQHPASFDPLPIDGLSNPLSTVDLHRRRTEIRQAAEKRIFQILAAGFRDPSVWKHVHVVNAIAYRFSTHHLATILHMVHDNLVTLHLHCAQSNIEYARWGPHDGILSKLGDMVKPFPLLAHLDLSVCHNSSYDQVLRFVGLAPGIETLRVVARDELALSTIPDPPDEPWLGLPDFDRLHTLSFDFPDDDGLPDLCQAIIMKAPHLRKVTLGDIWADLEEDGWSDEDQGNREDQYAYLEPLSALDGLEYLDWRCGSYHVFHRAIQLEGVFAGLKTVVVDGNIYHEYMERLEGIDVPAMPALETLVFRTRHPVRAHDLEADTSHDDTSPTRRLRSRTLRQLSAAPRLATVRFSRDDDIDLTLTTPVSAWHEVGIRGAVITTYRNGTHELAHVRTLTRSQLRSDPVIDEDQQMDDSSNSDQSAELEDGYETGDRLLWEHAVAYDGEFLSASTMDDAFGEEEVGWRSRAGGRDVHLPERAWMLLEKAKERVLPESRLRTGNVRRLSMFDLRSEAGFQPGIWVRPHNARDCARDLSS